MAANTKERFSGANIKSASILTGLIYDETGDRLSPVHAMKKGVRYRYYISNRLSHGGTQQTDGWRIPADQLEQPVLNILCEHLTNPLKLGKLIQLNCLSVSEHQSLFATAAKLAKQLAKSPASKKKQLLASFVSRIELQPDRLIIRIDASSLLSTLSGEQDRNDRSETDPVEIKTIELKHQLRRRGVEAKLVFAEPEAREPDPDHHLIKLVAKAHLWAGKLSDGSATSIGDLATQQNEDPAEVSRFLPLGFLAPDIVESILTGTHPVDLTIQRLREIASLPIDWKEQRELLGFAV